MNINSDMHLPADTTIQQGKDGKYRWVYEMNLYKNPTILLLILKIFAWIIFGMWIFLVILQAFDSLHFWDDFVGVTKAMLLTLVIILAVCTLGYYVYTIIMGGKYCVMFEMDEQGVLHKQLTRQAKKAHVLSALTVLSGAAAGNVGTMGTGLLAARTSMYSNFSSVKSIEAYPKRHVIKVNAPLNYNQVYADEQDFDWVLQFINEHTNNKKKKRT